MRRAKVLATASMRMAAAFAAMYVVSAALLFGIVYGGLSEYANGQTRSAVEIEARALAAEGESDGLFQLGLLIRERSVDGDAHYLLLDPQGQAIAGELPPDFAREGWTEAPDTLSVREREPGSLMALGVRLADGALLVVAHDTRDRDELLDAVLAAFASAAAISVLVALGSGFLLSRAFLNRIDGFTAAAARVMEGHLGERIPVTGAGDEYDRLAHRLNAMLERIESLVAGMRQVSSDVAHDLRTPLSRLRQNLELARRKGATVADYEAAVDAAIAETDDILATFAALLRIAQIEAGSRKAGFARLNLSDSVAAIAEAYEAAVEDSGRRLVARIEPGIAVTGDRELLMQMLSNLIENAVRHTPSHSIVELALGRGGGGPVVVVADNGTGVSEEEHRKVFQRFYRLDRSRSTAGSGLGLALVAAVAELHGIAVTLADNRPGLRIVLTFPAATS